MFLERWDEARGKWLLYTNAEALKADCERYPFDQIPERILLDISPGNAATVNAPRRTRQSIRR